MPKPPKFPHLEQPSLACYTAIPDNVVRLAHSQQQQQGYLLECTAMTAAVAHSGRHRTFGASEPGQGSLTCCVAHCRIRDPTCSSSTSCRVPYM